MGSWAGPMIACATVFHAGDERVHGVTDSKKLSTELREKLRWRILDACYDIGFGWVDAPEIDRLGHEATHRRVLVEAIRDLHCSPDTIYVDGNMYLPELHRFPVECVVGGDLLLWPVGAASIMAKQEQCEWMEKVAEQRWPGYGFAQHHGYGTPYHRMALERKGPCLAHRMSLKPLRKFVGP